MFKKLWNWITKNKIIRFGAGNSWGAVAYAIIVLILERGLRWDPFIVTTIAQACNSLINFFVIKKMIFRKEKPEQVHRMLLRHIVATIFQFFLFTGIMYVFVDIIHIVYWVIIVLLLYPKTVLGKYLAEQYVFRKNLQ